MLHKKYHKSFIVVIIFTAIFFSFGFSNLVSDSDWELVYENSSTGQKLYGNIDELIDAVLNGSDIKVLLHFESEKLHYQMTLSKVKVDLDKKIVTGYNYDFRANPSDSNVYERISSYSTTGEYISICKENPYFRNPEIIRVSMSWFAKID
jgi:hypothetical protein